LDTAVTEYLRGLGDGFLGKVVELFMADAPLRMHEVRAAVFHDDAPAGRVALHRLKGNCYLLGAADSAELCARMEMLACTGDLAGVELLIDSLDSALDGASRALQLELERSSRAQGSSAPAAA